jgi:hypothetical protein
LVAHLAPISQKKGDCSWPPYVSPKRGMPHASCLPYQLAGWDVDYPAPSVPHASPTPRRQAQRYPSPPGEEPGRGYSARAIKVAAPPSAMGCGRTFRLPTCGRKKPAPRQEYLCAILRSPMSPSLRRKICHHIDESFDGYSPRQSRHLATRRAMLTARTWALSIFTSRASEGENFKRAFAQLCKRLDPCCRRANSL